MNDDFSMINYNNWHLRVIQLGIMTLLLAPYICFSQTTHSVSVAINQPDVCDTQPVLGLENEDFTWIIYPNPSNDYVFLKSDAGSGIIQILDLSGRLIIQKKFYRKDPSLDISSVPQGIYLILLITDQTESIQKLKID